MSLEDICALPIRSVAADDAVLFCWTTVPMLMCEAPAVLRAWGFEYKTHKVWDKENFGMGHYWRQHETAGNPRQAACGSPQCTVHPGVEART